MLRKLLLAGAVLAASLTPISAKNLAVPEKSPIATIVIPDKWKPEEIQYGYSAKSPDGDIFFSVEYANAARIDKMFALNNQWMKENKIKIKSDAREREFEVGGLPAKIMSYDATDENGDTKIDFVMIPAGKQLILITIWGSAEEREANKDDILAIQQSLKAIN